MIKAFILSVGDELTLCQTVDTNSAWMSQQLATVGCPVDAHLTVADDQRAIEQAIEEAVGRCDFLLISGGIGPTEDDLTRQALAAVLGEPLETDESWLSQLRAFFAARGRPMPDLNKIQAMHPRGSRIIHNTNGTAAGIDATFQSGDLKDVCRIFVMPGVPKEMKAMFARDVLPHVAKAGGGACILSRTLHTYGLGESAIAEKLGELMRRNRNPSVGTTVSEGRVSLRVNASFPSAAEARERLERTVEACRAALGPLVFGQDGQTLAEVVARALIDSPSPVQVTTAESCTGGLLSKLLTDQPGSSKYFKRGWVTYSNEAKQDLLGVPADLLREHGAVSEPVALAMARGAARAAGADYALAVSGIAGPDGGTPAKPVGTVCIALAHPGGGGGGAAARTFNFPGDRDMIRERSAFMALALLRFQLLGVRPPF